jgi:hypothetical protein
MQVRGLPVAEASTFLSKGTLERRIADVLRGTGLKCAVAFWGQDADARIPAKSLRDARLICNLRSGGTNPQVIRKLWTVNRRCIRQHDALHAKVYLSSAGAVVTSANLSANGLGHEGNAAALWEEAGVFLPPGPDIARIADWFDNLWDNRARAIKEADLAAAAQAWEERQRVNRSVRSRTKRSRRSIADFDPIKEGWWSTWDGWEDWTMNGDAVRRYLKREPDATVRRLISGGAEISGEDDYRILKNRWILWWTPNLDKNSANYGEPERLEWVKLGDVFAKESSINEGGKTRDNLLQAEGYHRSPFDPMEPAFFQAFGEVLSLPRFRELKRIYPEEKSWFVPRQQLNRRFWIALRRRYLELAAD